MILIFTLTAAGTKLGTWPAKFGVRRTIPRTLGWGLAVVAVLYALLNLSYAVGLGWIPFQHSTFPRQRFSRSPSVQRARRRCISCSV